MLTFRFSKLEICKFIFGFHVKMVHLTRLPADAGYQTLSERSVVEEEEHAQHVQMLHQFLLFHEEFHHRAVDHLTLGPDRQQQTALDEKRQREIANLIRTRCSVRLDHVLPRNGTCSVQLELAGVTFRRSFLPLFDLHGRRKSLFLRDSRNTPTVQS